MDDKVYLIGVGMGNAGTLTLEALETIRRCTLLVGAPRLLEPWREEKNTLPLIRPEEIAAVVAEHNGPAAVLFSGDSGFYSGANRLRPLLAGRKTVTLPGISSLSYFCARLGLPWQDVFVVSAHGRKHNAVGEIQCHARTFVLTGGAERAEELCAQLCSRGLGQVQIWVGERLSYPDERICSGTAEELAGEHFESLAVLLAENPAPVEQSWTVPGLSDRSFQRGKVPMTKAEVRTLILSRLRPERDSVIWDVGAGTGSVSVECALAASAGLVCAVERDPEALALLTANAAALGCPHVRPVPGDAPEVLSGLPAPDRVFVGGSGGALRAILAAALKENPQVRAVVSAVTLETLQEAVAAFAALSFADVDIVQIGVTRTRTVGRYHMMDAQNPVWLISGTGGEA